MEWICIWSLVLVVIWTFVELPVELMEAQTSSERATLCCSKGVVLVMVSLAGLQLRWAETAFAFLCGLSLLAIAPSLGVLIELSPDAFFYSLVECVLKLLALVALVFKRA